jgi:O-antigen/teichoic acid export membrane protein
MKDYVKEQIILSLRSKFRLDLLFNVISLGLAAIVGILLNIIIIKVFGSNGLGYFNQVYAFYLLFSQFTVWGVHLSVQKYIPQYNTNAKVVSEILTSSLLLTFIISCISSIIIYIFREIPGYIINSKLVIDGFVYIIPGLVFFSLNKVLFSYFNGMRYMKTYAILSCIRYLGMLLSLIAIIWIKADLKYIVLVFTIPEILILIVSMFLVIPIIILKINKRIISIAKLQFIFGNKAALGNLALGTKPDIIILGFFLSDAMVGLYSFASTVIDGFVQLFYVFRNNINPLLTNIFFKNEKLYMQNLIKKNIKIHYKIFILLGFISIVCYPLMLYILNIKENIELNISSYVILQIGCMIASAYIPFQMIFNQTGFPHLQTRFLVSVLIFSTLSNIFFIYIFGLIGAAIATSSAFVFQMILLKIMVRNKLGIRI